ncbi:MAG: sigma-70 family RNA polymerase sigma factor [Cycloclasticus sp.]
MRSSEQSAQRQRDEKNWLFLMKKSQAGDAVAYHQLLSELGVVIESYLRVNFGQLGVLEDYVQESLLAIHRARHTFDPKRDFRPWMFTIVKYKTIDILRRNETKRNITSSFSKRDLGTVDPVDLDRMIDGDRLMCKLSDDQREAVTLTKYFGMTTNEVSQLIGITEGAVKARLRRALKTLTKKWQLDEAGPNG